MFSLSQAFEMTSTLIENFNFESDKNNDNGVYSFEIRIDENDIKESINIPILLPKNGNNNYLNETSMSEQNIVNHRVKETKKLLSVLENLNSHKINNTFPQSYNQFPSPIFTSDNS